MTKNPTAWKTRSGYGTSVAIDRTPRITQSGDTRVTQAGDTRILNSSSVTQKADTVWDDPSDKNATPWMPRSGYGDVSTRSGFITINGTDYLLTSGTDKLLLGTTVVTPKASTVWEEV